VTRKISDKEMIGTVLAHPLRCKILMILARRDASPVEIGREIAPIIHRPPSK